MKKTIIENRSNRVYLCLGLVLIVFIMAAAALDLYIAAKDHFRPDYGMLELEPIVGRMEERAGNGPVLTEEDYRTLFYQTGLGVPAVDALYERYGQSPGLLLARLESFQRDFFADVQVSSRKFGIITFEESLVDPEGRPLRGFQLAPLEDGDIFVSFSTHSLGYRHGHGALVMDAEKRITLEAVLIGYDSIYQKADKWRKYPSFVMLRLNGENGDADGAPARAVRLAAERMVGVPYGLLTGMPDKAPPPERVRRTQCAHVVWYPYYQAGYDLDSDGWWLVTPQDLAGSSHLDVVQIYGVDPERFWP